MAFDAENVTLQGIGGGAGLCIGRAVVVDAAVAPESESSAEPVILVGVEFLPQEVVSMDGAQVCGFVCGTGGKTAQAGTVALEKGLVALFNCPGLHRIQTGDFLVLDGTTGEVQVNPSPETITGYQARLAAQVKEDERTAQFRYLPAETLDGYKMDILASVHLLDAVAPAIVHGAGGIGLFRSEFYYLTDDGAPSEEFLFSVYQHGLTAVAPLPLTVRCLDLPDGSSLVEGGSPPEKHPLLGLQGVRFSLAHPGLFKTQLRALFRASGFGSLRILLPMISSLDELRAIKRIMAEVQNELSKAGVAVADQVAIGLLVEVPATLQVLAALAEQVDFLAIDGDDLFQYGFAVDRQCGEVTHLHNSLEPALVRMLDQAVRVGHAAGIDVGLLGEMAGQPQYAPLLIGLSLDWLSMPAQFIGGVKEMVRQSLAADCEQLGASLLSQDSLADGQDVLQEYLASQYRKYRTKKITKGYGRT